MRDGYREGYEKGKSDAQQGKKRNMRPPLGTAVVKGQNYTNTDIEGYKEGYRLGKKSS